MQSRPQPDVLTNIAEIYTERASFELNEDEIHVLRRHFNSVASLKDAPQARTSELQEREREFDKWKASHLLCLACIFHLNTAKLGLVFKYTKGKGLSSGRFCGNSHTQVQKLAC